MTRNSVKQLVAEAFVYQNKILNVNELCVCAEYDQYNLDELDIVEITMYIEEQLKGHRLNDCFIKNCKTIEQLIEYIYQATKGHSC